MFLIVYMSKVSRGVYVDHVEPIESQILAEKRFSELMTDESLFDLKLCQVIKSAGV
jgi:hypothetical protein